MRRHIYKIMCATMMLLMSASAHAQFVKLDKYPTIPAEYEAAFLDQVSHHVAGVVKSMYGQYFGQLSPEGNIYGFGSFFTSQDGEAYGLYRNGDLAFGIKKGVDIAKVGTNEHYIAYDLTTGYPIYIMKDNQKYNPSTEMREQNRFLVLKYANGDQYVGESTDNKREGYGLYFYANGDFYYGRFKDNARCGFGAMFKQESNTLIIQGWD